LLTPRLATNNTGTVTWTWEGDAFGATLANEDVDGDLNLETINLRFPGQYADVESGLSDNYFRHYDSGLGRYITSDPIGLQGGLNTFGYVGGDPIYWSDKLGLASRSDTRRAWNIINTCFQSLHFWCFII